MLRAEYVHTGRHVSNLRNVKVLWAAQRHRESEKMGVADNISGGMNKNGGIRWLSGSAGM